MTVPMLKRQSESMLTMTLMNMMMGVIVNMMSIMNIIINIMMMITTFVPQHRVDHPNIFQKLGPLKPRPSFF